MKQNTIDVTNMDRMAQRIYAAYREMPAHIANEYYLEGKAQHLSKLNRAQAYCECQSLDDENLERVVNGLVSDGCELSADAIRFILRNFWKLDCRC